VTRGLRSTAVRRSRREARRQRARAEIGRSAAAEGARRSACGAGGGPALAADAAAADASLSLGSVAAARPWVLLLCLTSPPSPRAPLPARGRSSARRRRFRGAACGRGVVRHVRHANAASCRCIMQRGRKTARRTRSEVSLPRLCRAAGRYGSHREPLRLDVVVGASAAAARAATALRPRTQPRRAAAAAFCCCKVDSASALDAAPAPDHNVEAQRCFARSHGAQFSQMLACTAWLEGPLQR
jgi:hypothetical protein